MHLEGYTTLLSPTFYFAQACYFTCSLFARSCFLVFSKAWIYSLISLTFDWQYRIRMQGPNLSKEVLRNPANKQNACDGTIFTLVLEHSPFLIRLRLVDWQFRRWGLFRSQWLFYGKLALRCPHALEVQYSAVYAGHTVETHSPLSFPLWIKARDSYI